MEDSAPEQSTVEQSEVGNGDGITEDESSKNEPISTVLDTIQHLHAEMALIKSGLVSLQTPSQKKSKTSQRGVSESHAKARHNSETSISDEEGMLASSDDNEGTGSTPSIDTRIKSMLTSKDNETLAKSNAESGALLGEIVLDLKVKAPTAKAVNKELGSIVDSLLGEKLPDAKLQAKVELYPRPENLKGLTAPRVNQWIWQQLSTSVKTYDSKQQKTQHALLACVAAILKVADLALETNLDMQTIVTNTTDAVALAPRPECAQEIPHEKGTPPGLCGVMQCQHTCV